MNAIIVCDIVNIIDYMLCLGGHTLSCSKSMPMLVEKVIRRLMNKETKRSRVSQCFASTVHDRPTPPQKKNKIQ